MIKRILSLAIITLISVFVIAKADTFPFFSNSPIKTNTFSQDTLPNQSHPEVTVNTFFDNGHALLIWNIPKEMKLYRDRISLTLKNAGDAKLGKIDFPKAKMWNDPLLGPQPVYYHQMSLRVPLYGKIKPGAQLQILYQTCFKDQCLPFQRDLVDITLSNGLPIDQAPNIPHKIDHTQDQKENSIWWQLLSLFGLGLLLSFTPCILPMLPIISGLVLGQSNSNKFKGLLLSISYVLGMALTYTGIGIVIALLGASFQAIFQTPIFIIITAIILELRTLSLEK